ncbi:MAG: retropepsin-like aspartic protease [Bacteroidia bacterium]
MKFKFKLATESDLIVVTTLIKLKSRNIYYPLSLVLDTGASHTVIDLNMLIVAGYDKSLRLDKNVKVQTANKIIDADKFALEEIKLSDRSLINFEVTTYDFLAQDDLLDYDGVLGLDFFKDTILSIDFKRGEVTITQ